MQQPIRHWGRREVLAFIGLFSIPTTLWTVWRHIILPLIRIIGDVGDMISLTEWFYDVARDPLAWISVAGIVLMIAVSWDYIKLPAWLKQPNTSSPLNELGMVIREVGSFLVIPQEVVYKNLKESEREAVFEAHRKRITKCIGKAEKIIEQYYSAGEADVFRQKIRGEPLWAGDPLERQREVLYELPPKIINALTELIERKS